MRELGMTVTLSSRSLRSMWSCFVRPESDTSASSRVAASSSILKATMTERLLLHGRFALRLRDMTHRLIELSCDRPFSARHQVDVTVRHRLPRMSEARSYRGYRHAHRHEHGGVAVAQVVDPYAPHLCRFSAPRHLVVEEVLGHAREYPRVRVRYRVHHQVLVELLGEKSRHGDRPVRLRSLRGGVRMSSPPILATDLLTLICDASKSMSAGVRASISPTRSPHQNRISKARWE